MSGSTWRSSRTARCLTVLGTALTALGLAASSPASAVGPPNALTTATVTCVTPTVPMYHVDGLAQLRRWDYASPLDGSSGWTEQAIGTGWGSPNVVFSGGDGVLYLIDSAGNLRWYQDNAFNGTVASWNPFSGSVIGTGWGSFTTVVSGGQGVVYAIDSSGNLRWYRYIGTNGSFSWAPGSGTVIGTGWNTVAKLAASGSGVLYAVTPSGGMLWYQELNPLTGTGGWANGGIGRPIGSGWSGFTQIGSMGGGVILARDSTGGTWWYRHTDPLGGSFSWANGGVGINEGSGWNNSQIVADVTGCVAS